jgi:hypothetical protein
MLALRAVRARAVWRLGIKKPVKIPWELSQHELTLKNGWFFLGLEAFENRQLDLLEDIDLTFCQQNSPIYSIRSTNGSFWGISF